MILSISKNQISYISENILLTKTVPMELQLNNNLQRCFINE